MHGGASSHLLTDQHTTTRGSSCTNTCHMPDTHAHAHAHAPSQSLTYAHVTCAAAVRCSLDTTNHAPLELNDKCRGLLHLALYVQKDGEALSAGEKVLRALNDLHRHATSVRRQGAREGQIFDWLPLAARGGVAARTWRDALLALKTRDAEHVVLGPVLADGTGSIRDMSEGVSKERHSNPRPL